MQNESDQLIRNKESTNTKYINERKGQICLLGKAQCCPPFYYRVKKTPHITWRSKITLLYWLMYKVEKRWTTFSCEIFPLPIFESIVTPLLFNLDPFYLSTTLTWKNSTLRLSIVHPCKKKLSELLHEGLRITNKIFVK